MAEAQGKEEVAGYRQAGEKRKKQKLIKKMTEANLVLGVEVQIEEALEAAERTLVGRAGGKNFSAQFIQNWADHQWQAAPGNSFKVSAVLAKGWFMIQFDKKEMAEWVLAKNWGFGNRPILFKRWTPLFDAQREKVDSFPVWVRAPGLPFFLWVESVFRSIGNMLGTYLETDMSFIETHERAMARILVNLNPDEGLAENIKLRYKDLVFDQPLDYEHLPFRCHRCHEYGHLVRDCPLRFRRRRKQKKVQAEMRTTGEEIAPRYEAVQVDGAMEVDRIEKKKAPMQAQQTMLPEFGEGSPIGSSKGDPEVSREVPEDTPEGTMGTHMDFCFPAMHLPNVVKDACLNSNLHSPSEHSRIENIIAFIPKINLNCEEAPNDFGDIKISSSKPECQNNLRFLDKRPAPGVPIGGIGMDVSQISRKKSRGR